MPAKIRIGPGNTGRIVPIKPRTKKAIAIIMVVLSK